SRTASPGTGRATSPPTRKRSARRQTARVAPWASAEFIAGPSPFAAGRAGALTAPIPGFGSGFAKPHQPLATLPVVLAAPAPYVDDFMKRKLIIASLLAVATPFASASETGDSAAYASCMDAAGGVTLAMLECMASETTLHDQRLNAAYRAAMASL